MSRVRLYGDTSGFIELKAPDVASDSTVTLPNSDIATESYVQATAAPLYFTENVVSPSSDYTLVLSDLAKVVTFDTSESLTLFVPSNASVPFPIGSVVNVYYAGGSGTITIQGAAGVTVRNAGAIADPYVEVSLRKRATDEWVLSGNVT
jgi:hypothetical protein